MTDTPPLPPLTAEQRQEMAIPKLRRHDLDGDGQLTRAELRESIKAMVADPANTLVKRIPCDPAKETPPMTPSEERFAAEFAGELTFEMMRELLTSPIAQRAFPKGVEVFTIDDLKPMIDANLQHQKSCRGRRV